MRKIFPLNSQMNALSQAVGLLLSVQSSAKVILSNAAAE